MAHGIATQPQAEPLILRRCPHSTCRPCEVRRDRRVATPGWGGAGGARLVGVAVVLGWCVGLVGWVWWVIGGYSLGVTNNFIGEQKYIKEVFTL